MNILWRMMGSVVLQHPIWDTHLGIIQHLGGALPPRLTVPPPLPAP